MAVMDHSMTEFVRSLRHRLVREAHDPPFNERMHEQTQEAGACNSKKKARFALNRAFKS